MRARGVALAAGAVVAVAAGALAWGIGSRSGTARLPESVRRGGLAEALGLPQEPENLARRRRHATVEAAVATCMRHAGFEYRPQPFAGEEAPAVGLPATAAEARARGYGIATALVARPTGDGGSGLGGDPGEPASDRQDQLTTMTAAERAAWEETLGRVDQPRSCRGRAEAAADRAMRSVLGDLEVLAAAYQRAAEASPRVAALDRRWTRCLADAGYRVADRAAAIALVDDRLSAARRGTAAGGAPIYDPDRLAAVQRFERALAAADVRCIEPLAEGYEAVRSDLADELRDAHRAEVTRVADALGHG